DRPAVRADGQLPDETLNDAQLAAGRRVPPADGAVPARGDGRLAVRTQDRPVHGVEVAGLRADILAGGRVPQADRPVPRRGRNRPAVAREGERFDPRVLLLQGEEVPAGGNVPQFDQTVTAAGGQRLAVRGEGDGRGAGVLPRRPGAVARVQLPLLPRG